MDFSPYIKEPTLFPFVLENKKLQKTTVDPKRNIIIYVGPIYDDEIHVIISFIWGDENLSSSSSGQINCIFRGKHQKLSQE